MKATHTPGPWTWFVNAKLKLAYLATPGRGRLVVMDFDKWGNFTQPRFRDDASCIMRDVEDLITADHNGEAFTVNHPDARLIAAAPELLAALKNMLDPNAIDDGGAEARTAIAKAEGGT